MADRLIIHFIKGVRATKNVIQCNEKRTAFVSGKICRIIPATIRIPVINTVP